MRRAREATGYSVIVASSDGMVKARAFRRASIIQGSTRHAGMFFVNVKPMYLKHSVYCYCIPSEGPPLALDLAVGIYVPFCTRHIFFALDSLLQHLQ